MSIYILKERPTQEDLDRAHKEKGMILSFIHKSKSVIDLATKEAFQEGWLIGLGLKPDYRLALVIVSEGLDLEQVKKAYIENLESVTSTFPTFKDIFPKTISIEELDERME